MASIPLNLVHADAGELLKGAVPDAVYVHVPFCRHKCHYCDFYSIVDNRDRQDAFVERIEREIEAVSSMVDVSRVKSIFIGGGTPTLLEPARLARVLAAISQRLHPGGEDLEWTVEANPETVDAECARVLAEGGVNRVSMGCQSFHPQLLKTLERWHDPESVPRAIDHVRNAGISRVNLDLIFAIPDSSIELWASDLEQALALSPSHLSCYGLVFEPGTALSEKRRQGRIKQVDDELHNEMYEHTRTRLGESGFEQYEISNWALPGEQCLHNLAYWHDRSWLPIGPAAAGHVSGARWRNIPRLDDWLAHGPLSPVVDLEQPDPARAVGDALMMGLRITSGLPEARIDEILAMDPEGLPRRKAVLDAAIKDGRLMNDGGQVRFSSQGTLVADDVLADLL